RFEVQRLPHLRGSSEAHSIFAADAESSIRPRRRPDHRFIEQRPEISAVDDPLETDVHWPRDEIHRDDSALRIDEQRHLQPERVVPAADQAAGRVRKLQTWHGGHLTRMALNREDASGGEAKSDIVLAWTCSPPSSNTATGASRRRRIPRLS